MQAAATTSKMCPLALGAQPRRTRCELSMASADSRSEPTSGGAPSARIKTPASKHAWRPPGPTTRSVCDPTSIKTTNLGGAILHEGRGYADRQSLRRLDPGKGWFPNNCHFVAMPVAAGSAGGETPNGLPQEGGGS